MKIAAIYDIHGNLTALNAVLEEIYSEEIEMLLVGGDVVAGPLPNETLTRLIEIDIPTQFILGNAESEVLSCLTNQAIGGLSERAEEEARWLSKKLTKEHINFLRDWESIFSVELEKWGKVIFCHGTPRSDVEIFTQNTSEQKLLSIFASVAASLVVCGHTHIQFDRSVGKTRIVNAGSVGMAFGATGANWLLLNEDIEMRHTEYNLAEAADLIMQSDYPYAKEFVENYVLQTPSKENMLALLTEMEKRQSISIE